MRTIGMFLFTILFFGFSILSRAESKNNCINTNKGSNNLKLYTSLLSYEQAFKKQTKKDNKVQNIVTQDVENIENNEDSISNGEESESLSFSTCEYTTIFIYKDDKFTSNKVHYIISLFDLSNANCNLPKKE
jgi:hypothetical protein